MSFTDIFKRSFLEQFTGAIGLKTIVITLGIAIVFSLIVFLTYKYTSKSVIYSKEFNITTSLMSVVTAAVVLSMQANIIISLGMVEALSIVRFRTAIKEPRDLLFLFWSISNGIIVGAGVFMLAGVLSVILPIGLLLFELFPVNKIPYLLVVNASGNIEIIEKEIEERISKINKTKYKIKSRNCSKDKLSIVYEVSTTNATEIFTSLSLMEQIINFNLISQDGEGQF